MKEGEVEAQDGWISIYGGAKGGSRADPPFRSGLSYHYVLLLLLTTTI